MSDIKEKQKTRELMLAIMDSFGNYHEEDEDFEFMADDCSVTEVSSFRIGTTDGVYCISVEKLPNV